MYRPRSIRFIRREDLGDWRLKVYGIGTHAPDARAEFVAATLDAAREALPERGGAGFVIAHDAQSAGLALVYWWDNDNEIHAREILELRRRLEQIYARHTGQSVEQIHDDMDRDRFFSAEQAVDYGLVDRIINERALRRTPSGFARAVG